jgi:hypothetical protein
VCLYVAYFGGIFCRIPGAKTIKNLRWYYLAASQTLTNGRLSRKTSLSWSPEVKKWFNFTSYLDSLYLVNMVFIFHIPWAGVCRTLTTFTGPCRTETTSSASPFDWEKEMKHNENHRVWSSSELPVDVYI